ncbi:MAG TPA: hypothetical protein VL915_05630 [Gemmatimonadales bacterium]|nr:hypothetical protein [Gemmatimonadales bacterium]
MTTSQPEPGITWAGVGTAWDQPDANPIADVASAKMMAERAHIDLGDDPDGDLDGADYPPFPPAIVDVERGPIQYTPPPTSPPSIPTPTAYRKEWWPVMVRWPGLKGEPKVAKAYATRQGLFVFTAPNTEADPAFFSPIDYDKTTPPTSNYAATRNKRTVIHTDAGEVSIYPLGGCGCNHRALKAWRPSWATRNEAWS